MKDENVFNSKLSSWFKSYWSSKGFFHIKSSDKYREGISDFILWGNSRSCALESKFIMSIPEGNKMWLNHKFTPPQRTFLHCIEKTGNLSVGLIGVRDKRMMLAIPRSAIPECGNIRSEEGGVWFPITKEGAGSLIDYLVGG